MLFLDFGLASFSLLPILKEWTTEAELEKELIVSTFTLSIIISTINFPHNDIYTT